MQPRPPDLGEAGPRRHREVVRAKVSDRLETVARVFRPAQLLLIQSLLRQADILVCPVGYHHLTNQWPIALGLGGIELRVPEVQADDARALLESVPPLWMPPYQISRNGLVRALALLILYCF